MKYLRFDNSTSEIEFKDMIYKYKGNWDEPIVNNYSINIECKYHFINYIRSTKSKESLLNIYITDGEEIQISKLTKNNIIENDYYKINPMISLDLVYTTEFLEIPINNKKLELVYDYVFNLLERMITTPILYIYKLFLKDSLNTGIYSMYIQYIKIY